MKKTAKKIKIVTGIILILLLLGCTTVLIKGYFDGYFHSAESLQAYVNSFGIWAPMVLTLIQVFQVVLPVLPGFFGCIVGATLFGPVGGFVCNYIGISSGSFIAFHLARKYGVSFVKSILSPAKYDKYTGWVEKRQKSYLIILWLAILLPLAPDDFFCYFSGLTKMTYKKFFWTIVLAKPWCILAYSLIFGNVI
ncbi:MAG: VTT domain-containing protein [Clostridia bacterium]|nr:VTT domain-containing protein [Clostridia bacterium]